MWKIDKTEILKVWCELLLAFWRYRPVSGVVIHSNKLIGPQWPIYPKTDLAFELV